MARGPEWTPTEDAIIAAAAGAGRGPADAASKMTGRTPGSVKVRACRIGIKFGPPKPDPTAKQKTPSPTPAPPPLADVERIDSEAAQDRLSYLAVHASDERTKIAALQALLQWREKQPAPTVDRDAVPAELLQAWQDPVFGPFLRKLLARAAAGRSAASEPSAATP